MGDDIFLKGVDHFDFQPKLTSEPTAPQPYEVKLEDVLLTTYTIGSEPDIDGFIIDGSADAGHTGGANVMMGDGSVRFYNPYVTVDYIEVV